MSPAEIALDYWTKSRHYAALPEDRRDEFLLHIVTPAYRRAQDPLQQKCLGRLLERGRRAA